MISDLHGLLHILQVQQDKRFWSKGRQRFAEGKDFMNAKRGYLPEDVENFSEQAVQKLRTASRHVQYLINEGYDLKQSTVFVGNRFQLSERQRLALMRSICTGTQLSERKEKERFPSELYGEEVWMDGFNTVITFEVMHCGSILFEGMDGCIRDLASLRGTYRIIPETAEAVRTFMNALESCEIKRANILLDEPVSNSGRLKALIAEIAEDYRFDLDIRVHKDVDRELYTHQNVITSDSIILDHCSSWVNLTAACLGDHRQKVFRVW